MSNAVKREYLCFSITGEFVTKTARSWLYEEKRPYTVVLKFLLSCMCGTRHKEKTLIKFANDVLAGKMKFTGTTKNNSFCMVKDDVDVLTVYSLFFENTPKQEEKIVLTDDEEICNTGMKNIRAYQKRIKNNITKKDYGWLNPEGKYYPVGWGEHELWARNYVEKHFPKTDFSNPFFYHGDFLVKNGWLLLHNPCLGAIYLPKEKIQLATKRQKEFLYDYFFERELFDEANAVWKE